MVVTSRRDLRNFNRGDDNNNAPSPREPALDEPARQIAADGERRGSVLRSAVHHVVHARQQTASHHGGRHSASYKTNDAFDGMQGSFFSSDIAPEVILQKSFAAELLGKTAKPGSEEAALAEIAKPLSAKK